MLDGSVQDVDTVPAGLVELLHDRFGVEHATLQVEATACDVHDLYE